MREEEIGKTPVCYRKRRLAGVERRWSWPSRTLAVADYHLERENKSEGEGKKNFVRRLFQVVRSARSSRRASDAYHTADLCTCRPDRDSRMLGVCSFF